ncbi:MAG TPA: ATP-binding protein, partial [Gammaproteobacteria bacterium]|nr:ATP-binding protein [Gammaproteobacteria bacterium]
MGNLEQLARYESANSAVILRETAYGAGEGPELLRDLIGLANARVEGPRYVFLGIADGLAGERRIVGIPDSQIRKLHELCEELVSQYVEPLLLVRVEEVTIEGATVPVIVLPDCDDPPYLLKRNASGTMRVGGGWLRQGNAFRRLLRADFQHMFERKFLAHGSGAELRVGFEGRNPMPSICLPVMR